MFGRAHRERDEEGEEVLQVGAIVLSIQGHLSGNDRWPFHLPSFREIEEGLAELLHAAYPLVDGVLDPPAWRDASGGRLDEEVRLSAQRRLVGSFWRHNKSRELVHGARGQLSALRVRDQATPIAKKVRAKQPRARWCHVPEWVMPGVQTRHVAFKSTEWRVDPEEYLAALFAPLACPTRRCAPSWPNVVKEGRPIHGAIMCHRLQTWSCSMRFADLSTAWPVRSSSRAQVSSSLLDDVRCSMDQVQPSER